MRSSLLTTYWILFLTSIISSTLLFLIVASEATKTLPISSGEIPINANTASDRTEADLDLLVVDNSFENRQSDNKFNRIRNAVISGDKARADNVASDKDNAFDSDSYVLLNSARNLQADTQADTSADPVGINTNTITENGLPDIPQNPTVISLGEKSPELHIDTFEDVENIEIPLPNPDLMQNDTDLDGSDPDKKLPTEFLPLPEVTDVKADAEQIDEKAQKIDDSGGLVPPDLEAAAAEVPLSSNASGGKLTEVNLTTEEVPIPVFSEWAQKQMEEAEKEVVGSSAQKKNATAEAKPQVAKFRTKNYASPDCGAKIIASNSDAQHTGAVLTSTKDEYMLSPCKNRIWFVVELCEAIQAEKVDLANFELFSSSPKNFTVAVGNRFPSRDWSNVGRFEALDSRNIQSFDLHPHLFGKFVRVDIHSHYNSEHYCPVSLFRVFGTSEFEAFETENRLNEDLDDYDEDDGAEQAHMKNENNLIKSASDAVLSIVKKAAEVLVKTNTNKTDNAEYSLSKRGAVCKCPAYGQFTCASCPPSLVESANYLLSCRYYQLIRLLSIEAIRTHLITSQLCAKQFSIETGYSVNHGDCNTAIKSDLIGDRRQSYYLSVLPTDYLAAMCHMLAEPPTTISGVSRTLPSASSEDPSNLTIDRKHSSDDFENLTNKRRGTSTRKPKKAKLNQDKVVLVVEKQQPREEDAKLESLETPPPTQQADVNIFNVPEYVEPHVPAVTPTIELVPESPEVILTAPATEVPPAIQPTPTEEKTKDAHAEMEPSSWDSIDNLLSEQQVADGAGQNSQQRMPSGHHSESVFIRLSNRIKALERNMSLSGQYLEELSRRYKKQVEELQHSFAKTQQGIDDQNRYIADREQVLIEENNRLRVELEQLALQLRTWIVLLVVIGAIVVFQIFQNFYLGRRISRTQEKLEGSIDSKPPPGDGKKLYRRKSVEGVSGHQTPSPKTRRPSEEAMYIHGSYSDLLIMEDDDNDDLNESRDKFAAAPKYRKRKKSVCYISDAKNGHMKLKRQESAPGDYVHGSRPPAQRPKDPEELIFEEDYENYLPGSDLAYNEFMPDGPSGMKIILNDDEIKTKAKKSVKVRRLSSPAFLKSPFSKITSSKKTPHEPTSWEWYRSKKSPASSQNGKESSAPTDTVVNSKSNGYHNGDHNPSPNSSISEIMNLNGAASGSDNSLRASEISVNTNASLLSNGNNTSSSGSNRSSKKSRSFKKIFKKVF